MSIIIPFPENPLQGADLELQINRDNTAMFIEADPVLLTLTWREKIDNGSGGFKYGPPQNRDPQVFRMIPQSDIMPDVQGPDGVTLTPTYVLLGKHDAVMGRWDRFTMNGVKFMIVSPIRPDYTIENVYEHKADVARV